MFVSGHVASSFASTGSSRNRSLAKGKRETKMGFLPGSTLLGFVMRRAVSVSLLLAENQFESMCAASLYEKFDNEMLLSLMVNLCSLMHMLYKRETSGGWEISGSIQVCVLPAA
jgi:hypothetical protein